MHAGAIHGMHFLDAIENSGHKRPSQFMDEIAKDRIFLRGASNAGEWPDCILAMADGIHLHDRKIVPQAVIAKMVAEWAFRFWPANNAAADAKIRIRDNWRGRAFFVKYADAFATQQAGKKQFVQPFRQGHDGGNCQGRRSADMNAHGQFPAPGQGARMMDANAAHQLVVHSNFIRRIIIAAKLDAIHAQVERARLVGVLAQDKGQGDEGAAIRGPGNKLWQIGNCGLAFQHWSGRAFFGRHGTGAAQSAGRGRRFAQKGERVSLALQKRAGPGQAPAKNETQAFPCAVKIGQHGKGAALYPGEKQGRSFGRKGPSLDMGYFQARVKFMINAPEIACRFQVRDNPPEGRHQLCPGKGSIGARLRSLARTFPKSANICR